MKKSWENPKIENLNVGFTQDEKCYCEEGEIAVASLGYRKGGGGHNHNPKPEYGGNGHCPNKPVNKPATPGFGDLGPVTPELDAVPVS